MRKRQENQNKDSHKIALYIRVSTEEQASNPEGSIKSQEQRLRTLVDLRNQESLFGKIVGSYVDRAKSGKDTNRPELQRLLQAVRNREITMIMVSELSRLSRSIKDFCEIWELMRANGCEFQSLREQFDTTTAAGEMVLYTIANIAQFERKQTSERISANFRARAERGLNNGGSVPFGYDADPERKGYLVVNKEDATVVREAFGSFLREGCLSKAGISLNERGYRVKRLKRGGKARLGFFTIGNLHTMLRNKAYLGLRVYQVKSEERTSKAVWPAIIDEQTFSRVQDVLGTDSKRRRSRYLGKRYPYLLSGLLNCGVCGECLPGKSAHGNGGKIPYYEHAWTVNRQACLKQKSYKHKPVRVSATKLEKEVWERISSLVLNEEVAKSIVNEARNVHEKRSRSKEAEQLKQKLLIIDGQLEALAEHLSKIPKSVSPAPIFAQMQRLEEQKVTAQLSLETLLGSVGALCDMPAQLKDYKKLLESVRNSWSENLSHDTKSQILRRLVHRIEVLAEGFRIHYYTGKNHVNSDGYMPKEEAGGDLENSNSIKDPNFLDGGSKIILTGRGGRI
jgi:site-specific DNA recombinase